MTGTPFTLQILHFYGESGTLADQTAPVAAAMIEKFKTQYANTLTVAEGDTYIPGPWLVGGADPSVSAAPGVGSTALGRPDIAIMNAMGVDVSALGNHEFDLGSSVLSGAIGASGAWVGAQFPFVTDNLNFAGDSALKGLADKQIGGSSANNFAGAEASTIKGKITPSSVVTINGVKVGVVGVTTFELLNKSSPTGTTVKDDGNAATDKLQEAAALLQVQIDALKTSGVDKIIMVDQLDTLERDKAIAPMLSGVDVIVAGGGHERLGDSTDVAGAFNGHTPDFIASDSYPISATGSDGKTTLIVTTDTEFSYVGRLVVNFDANGDIVAASLDPSVNGAYASNAATLQGVYNNGQTAAQIVAGSASASKVKSIADAVNNVIVAKDSVVWGYSNVYLEGDRVFGRAQEVNLGDITADANAFKARQALALGNRSIMVSLKNGGGIRASVGVIDEDTFAKVGPAATANHPAGGITQLDVENALRFNNQLMVFDTTATGLRNILEYGVTLPAGNGGYAQLGGVRVSFDNTQPAGSRIRNLALTDASGAVIATIVSDGVVNPNAPATISVVCLNFTANGGDGYPIKANASNFRYLNSDGTISAAVDPALDFTLNATMQTVGTSTAQVLGEQKAFQDYLAAKYATPEKAYNVADTPASQDQRIENLAARSDAVFAAPWANPAHSDYSGDGLSDVLWRSADGDVSVWSMKGSAIVKADAVTFNGSPYNPGGYWTIAGQGDFSGDGKADVLWRGAAGEVAVWDMNGNAITAAGQVAFGGAVFNPGTYWSVAGIADFNGDGKADVLWRGKGGEVAVWNLDNMTIAKADQVDIAGSTYNPGSYWSIAGVGDFNGDGKADVLWRGKGGEVTVWDMNGSTITSASPVKYNGADFNPGDYWSVAGVADFNADGRADVLWRGQGGEVAIWNMNDATISSANQATSGGAIFNPGDYWRIAGTGDYNGDGAADILWRGNAGEATVWTMDNTAILGADQTSLGGSAFNPGNAWSIAKM